ncbi:MAG: hypothetical protein NC924_04400, partial [Candidatus Omnitrophica bacterium]|nr:hypothetical protein [Candidatus Omnitrophota bacterium]
MKNWLLFGSLVLIAAAGCSRGPQTLLLDSFEGPLSYQTVDYGSGNGATLEVSAETGQKTHGEQSIKLVYSLEGGYLWAARGYNLDVS